jgi:hypothetical protein
MFGSSPVVCMGDHVIFALFVFAYV